MEFLPINIHSTKYKLGDYQVTCFTEISKSQQHSYIRTHNWRGPWVAQSVQQPISAQVMISQLVGSGPTSGSVLTARSLEPASDSVSPSLSAPSLLMLGLSLLSKINKC